MFFVILEGFQTDSAKSSLGFLDDLSEGHLLFFNFEKKWQHRTFFPKNCLVRPHRRCRESKKGVWHALNRKKCSLFSRIAPQIGWFLWCNLPKEISTSRRCVHLRGNGPRKSGIPKVICNTFPKNATCRMFWTTTESLTLKFFHPPIARPWKKVWRKIWFWGDLGG